MLLSQKPNRVVASFNSKMNWNPTVALFDFKIGFLFFQTLNSKVESKRECPKERVLKRECIKATLDCNRTACFSCFLIICSVTAVCFLEKFLLWIRKFRVQTDGSYRARPEAEDTFFPELRIQKVGCVKIKPQSGKSILESLQIVCCQSDSIVFSEKQFALNFSGV